MGGRNSIRLALAFALAKFQGQEYSPLCIQALDQLPGHIKNVL